MLISKLSTRFRNGNRRIEIKCGVDDTQRRLKTRERHPEKGEGIRRRTEEPVAKVVKIIERVINRVEGISKDEE